MKKSLYVSGIVKDSKNNIEKYLFSENERLNAIIDELEDKIDKATEWVHKHISKYNCKGITIIDWDELSNPNDLLEILGDKENEEK